MSKEFRKNLMAKFGREWKLEFRRLENKNGVIRIVFEPGDLTRYELLLNPENQDYYIVSLLNLSRLCYRFRLKEVHPGYIVEKLEVSEYSAGVLAFLLDFIYDWTNGNPVEDYEIN
jgi:hypothetical protein